MDREELAAAIERHREELIDAIAQVLGAHDCADYATWCVCGKKLYTGDANQAATSMRRHRAQKILEVLETMEVHIT